MASAGGRDETPHKAKDVRRYFWEGAQSSRPSKESDKTLSLHTTLTNKSLQAFNGRQPVSLPSASFQPCVGSG